MGITFIVGGARSGKSAFAQKLAANSPKVVYVATATACDEEMQRRIEKHRTSRPASWTTLEEPVEVTAAIHTISSRDTVILLDCLTLWVSNLCVAAGNGDPAESQASILSRVDQLIEALESFSSIVVSNEVGSGIVPDSELGRFFRDIQGLANQKVAAASESAYQLISGLPVRLK
ncbi:MAG: bifunctional adenosylcobinamide kinase/adenosylcobinamide-phosphate guanylyltransferase [Acidobacteria bacterium]|nr:bifunctional adenosylcobinamide kinase/adenosylcobinamide-phosphate guanylyltransferase [Acidobacteriota bacterium]MCI0623145.1 bifunctional adenosylcobinamide kinase/adenosylcobinamide-phosphate guanylyltransferase [Acidobacteriota bacterium]MCI0723393.1 bifunctional adenosylcobinamide kinase/adenosylcobinamide-phosphate guanylyltransferase [Acidobacteriota bacterium]